MSRMFGDSERIRLEASDSNRPVAEIGLYGQACVQSASHPNNSILDMDSCDVPKGEEKWV